MNFLKSRKFFSAWFGIGIPPFLIGTVIVAFLSSALFGYVTLAVVGLWVYDTFTTTCCRCPFYGTGKCGIPSLLVPHILRRRSPYDLNLSRIRLHYYADLGMILYVNAVYWTVPFLFPIVAICSIIGWATVFKNEKFHGLLFRLDQDNSPKQHNTAEQGAAVNP